MPTNTRTSESSRVFRLDPPGHVECPAGRPATKMSHHFGLLVPQQAATAIQNGNQSHVLMAFQCRQVQKNGSLFLLVVRDHHHAGPAVRRQSDTSQYQIVCELKFISNRRLSDEQVFALGSHENALPTNPEDLAALREMLGIKDKKDRKSSIAWEVKVDNVLDPPINLPKVAPMVRDSGTVNAASSDTPVAVECQDWFVLFLIETCQL